MSRHLSIVERHIDGRDEPSYRESLIARRDSATAAAVHFWVFAHAQDSQRYVEFVEGSDAAQVAAVAGVDQGALWRAIEVK